MTKEEMITKLEKYIEETKLREKGDLLVSLPTERNVLMAMDLLASLKGYKNHICHKKVAPKNNMSWK